ncbi:hypothetical protein [Nocardioides fonticola]
MIVGIGVLALLFLGWRADPHHRVRGIDRRRPANEQAKAEAASMWVRGFWGRGGSSGF